MLLSIGILCLLVVVTTAMGCIVFYDIKWFIKIPIVIIVTGVVSYGIYYITRGLSETECLELHEIKNMDVYYLKNTCYIKLDGSYYTVGYTGINNRVAIYFEY